MRFLLRERKEIFRKKFITLMFLYDIDRNISDSIFKHFLFSRRFIKKRKQHGKFEEWFYKTG